MNEYGKYRHVFLYAPKQSVSPSRVKWSSRSYDSVFLNTFCTKFHGNPTDGLAADTVSQTDGLIGRRSDMVFS